LASALALPLTPEGSVFPYRDLALFLAFVIILFTLVAQGLSLASIVRLLRVGHDEAREEIRRARLEAAEAALRALDLLAADAAVSGPELGVLRDEYSLRIDQLGDDMRTASPTAGLRSLEYVRRKLIDAERQQLLSLSRKRDIGDAILRQLLSELDVAEIALGNRSKHQGPLG
jgi:CPA1 family monovalent cation:H+ antiporter